MPENTQTVEGWCSCSRFGLNNNLLLFSFSDTPSPQLNWFAHHQLQTDVRWFGFLTTFFTLLIYIWFLSAIYWQDLWLVVVVAGQCRYWSSWWLEVLPCSLPRSYFPPNTASAHCLLFLPATPLLLFYSMCSISTRLDLKDLWQIVAKKPMLPRSLSRFSLNI